MAADDEMALPPERTLAELEERHEKEAAEVEEKASAHVEAARAAGGKGKKAKAAIEAAEREADQWKYDLQERHKAEVEMLEEHLAQGGNDAACAPAIAAEPLAAPDAAAAPALTAEEEEAERARRKKEKAQKKKQGREARQAEHEAELDRERRQAGPSRRLLESAALATKLAKLRPPLRVLEVAADGNCLYRAVGDQLRKARPDLYAWKRKPEEVHEEVRALCAGALRKRADEYSPFAELKEGEDFVGYCDRVERSADWGGELELRALADELHARILVHRAEEAEPLALGEAADEGPPLQVTYHRHYYALGEHYNSVEPLRGEGAP